MPSDREIIESLMQNIKSMEETNQALLKRLEAAEQSHQEGWRPISEAKTDGTRYLVYAEGEQHVASWYNGYPHTEGVWMVAEGEEPSYIPEVISVYPTHFHPLLPNPLATKD